MKRSTKNSTRDIHSSLANTQQSLSSIFHIAYRLEPARGPRARRARPRVEKHGRPTTACQLYTACNPIAASAASQKQRSVLNSEVIPTSGNPVPRSQQPTCSHGTPTGQGPHTRALSINSPASPTPPTPPCAPRTMPTYAHLLTVDQRGPLRARTKHVVLTCTYIVGHRPHA